MARHDPDQDRELAGGLGEGGDQRARTLLAGGGLDERNDISSSSISFREFLRLLAFTDDTFRHRAGNAQTRAAWRSNGIRLLVCLGAHDVGDAEPLLVAVVGFDHAQHDHARSGTQCAAASGEINGAVALGVSSMTTRNFGE